MTVKEAKDELDRFVRLKTTQRPVFVDVIMAALAISDPGWIPVSSGNLPSEGVMVLVSCRSKRGADTVNRAYFSDGVWHGCGSMAGVMAWMPLPDPFSGGLR